MIQSIVVTQKDRVRSNVAFQLHVVFSAANQVSIAKESCSDLQNGPENLLSSSKRKRNMSEVGLEADVNNKRTAIGCFNRLRLIVIDRICFLKMKICFVGYLPFCHFIQGPIKRGHRGQLPLSKQPKKCLTGSVQWAMKMSEKLLFIVELAI